MKISINNNINYNYANRKAESKSKETTLPQKEVQNNCDKIKSTYNVAFFGLFGKHNNYVSDARYITGTFPLVPDVEYLISNDSRFQFGNTLIELSNPIMKQHIDGIKPNGSISYKTGNGKKDIITFSKNREGALSVKTTDKENTIYMLPNLVVPTSYDYPFTLQPGINYLLPQKSVIDMSNTRISLRGLKNFTDALKDGESVILGRGEEANIKYYDQSVSRSHLQLTKFNNDILVKDLHSKYGSVFQGIERAYQYDYSGITTTTALQRGIPTRIPNNCQLYLGYDLTLDMRNSNILDELNEKGSVTIGRSSECDIVVPSFYNQVSGNHLVLQKDENDIIATEMGSLNGTMVIPKNEIQPFNGDLENLSLNQGNVGDCYLLSAIYALSRNPRGRNILRNMVFVGDDGSYIVKFHNKAPISIKPNELDGQKKPNGKEKRSVSGDLGIKAIERAYGKMLKAEAERKKLINLNPEMTMFYKLDDGGYVDVALKRISGLSSSCLSTKNRNLYNSLYDISRSGVNNHVLTCTTPDKSKYSGFVDPQCRFISKHAYAIKDIDAYNQTISIVNPHNTKNTNVIRWDEFTEYFDYMYDAVV